MVQVVNKDFSSLAATVFFILFGISPDCDKVILW